MGFKVFWTRFDDFCFSRSPNPLHDSMYKVWVKNAKNFFLFHMQYKWVLRCFRHVLTTFVFRGLQFRYINSLLINTPTTKKKSPRQARPAGPPPGRHTEAQITPVEMYEQLRIN